MAEKILSLLLLSYHSSERLKVTHKKIVSKLEEENIPFELIIIDDGSGDDSYQIACNLEKQDNRVKAYQLSRNYTSHYAMFAGFKVSKGACASSVPDDLQIPLDIIVKMYRLWEKGQKIIVPFRASRNDGWLKDRFSNGYYKILNHISDVRFPKGGADGFLIDREIIDILNQRIQPRNTSTIVEVLRLGFDPVFIPYDRPAIQGNSRWTLRKKIKLAMDTILSSSSFPIKMITVLGVLSVFASFLLTFFSLMVKLRGGSSFLGFSIPGWTTNFVLTSLFSGLILFSLGIIAEYLWRVHEEVKGRPGYIIKKKQ